MMFAEPFTVWAISDRRPGHWNQVLGLTEALANRVMVRRIDIMAPTRARSVVHALAGRWRNTDGLPGPDLIIGAGHATHLPMLTARRSRGGRAIVLMKPTLPLQMFDLCLLPDLQTPQARENVLATRGAMNRMRPAARREPDSGVIMIGGPCRHVVWDQQAVLDQVFAVCVRSGDTRWQLTTSRRTPATFVPELHQRGLLNLTVVDGNACGADWLPQQLGRCEQAWVTVDSVSMVYETLTAGASVGLLELPVRQPRGKLARSLDRLCLDADVTRFSAWTENPILHPPRHTFAEADRCADEIVRRYFSAELARAA